MYSSLEEDHFDFKKEVENNISNIIMECELDVGDLSGGQIELKVLTSVILIDCTR